MVEDTGKMCSDKRGISLTVTKIPDRAEKIGKLLRKQCYLSNTSLLLFLIKICLMIIYKCFSLGLGYPLFPSPLLFPFSIYTLIL